MNNVHIVLFEPEIPANTGNIIRLCANTGAKLHLVHPLGFDLDDKRLRRAGLDYHEWAEIQEYQSLDEFSGLVNPGRVFAVSTRGGCSYVDRSYRAGDAFVFGPETRGLPGHEFERFAPQNRLCIPMMKNSRSLNLSNSVAVVLYEAWRQLEFIGAQRCS